MIHKWFHLGNILAFGFAAHAFTQSTEEQVYFLIGVCGFGLIRCLVGWREQFLEVTGLPAGMLIISTTLSVIFLMMGLVSLTDPSWVLKWKETASLQGIPLIIIAVGITQHMIYSGANEEPGMMDHVNFFIFSLIPMLLAFATLFDFGDKFFFPLVALLMAAVGGISTIFKEGFMKGFEGLALIRLIVGTSAIAIISYSGVTNSFEPLIEYILVVTWSVFGLTIINLVDYFRRT